jgi:peptide/nickel transport system permease protein
VLKYTLRRLAYAVPAVLGVATLGFVLIHLVPGDPGRAALGPRAPAAAVAALDRRFGLDEPVTTQYVHFLRGALTLNFGQSIYYDTSVSSLIGSRVGPTALLILYAMLIAVVVAVPLALAAAVHKEGTTDHVVRLGGMVTFVMPPFWLGLLLALVFGLELGIFPTGGYDSGSVLGALRSLTLPAVTLGIGIAPLILRTLRAAIIETLASDFIEAARARGFSERRVLYKHALRNSLVSTITVIGLIVGFLVSGTVLVENVFGIPGLGALLVNAVSARDFPVIQGLTVLMGAAVVVANLITDLCYAFVDPRVRL